MTLVYLAGAWLLGAVAAAIDGSLWWPAVAAMATAGVVAAALERRPQLALLGLLAAGLFVAGAVRYDRALPPDEPGGVAAHNDGPELRLRALVSDEVELRGRTQRVHLSVREVFQDGAWRPTSGGVLMRAPALPRYRYGDILELTGELETPPSFPDFDYREYLAQRGVGSLLAYPNAEVIATGQGNPALEALSSARERLGLALERELPEPQAALAEGILLGRRTAIPAGLTADMNATGTSHLVAISGQNVSLVAGFVIAGLAWLIGRRQAALVALAAIGAYTALTGASPSVVRAAIMGGLFVSATLVGRPASAATAIALSAAAMTAWDPLVLHDVSFQLSFAAILGLVYLSPGLEERGAHLLAGRGVDVAESGLLSFLLESSAVTMGAVLATLPLTALYFQRISLIAPAANLLVVPAFAPILMTSALASVAGTVWQPLGEAPAWAAWAALTYMLDAVRFFAATPFASVRVDGFGAWHAAAAYLALAVLAWWLPRTPRAPLDPQRVVPGAKLLQPAWALAGGLAVACALVWWAVLSDGHDGRLTVSVLDVGQGEAVLIETPDGQRLLVDGGPDGARLAGELSEVLPPWERRIDLIALTHPQDDHVTGLVTALERYDVRAVLASPAVAETGAYETFRDEVRSQELPYHSARAGDAIDLGDGAELLVLGPGAAALASGEPNDASLVLKVTWGDVSFLLTGDVEATGERALLASGADASATVLLVPHHGSTTSSTAAFLREVSPALAVVSVGAGNAYGHPAPSVLERLEPAPVLRTDQDGTVRLSTDGERLWVETER